MKKNIFFIKDIIFFVSGLIAANIFSVKGLAKELTTADTVAEITIVIICSFVIVKSLLSIIKVVFQVWMRHYNRHYRLDLCYYLTSFFCPKK
jgi:hypothetical protein